LAKLSLALFGRRGKRARFPTFLQKSGGSKEVLASEIFHPARHRYAQALAGGAGKNFTLLKLIYERYFILTYFQ